MTSTDSVRKSICDPPVLIPGLETSIIISEGSRLLVMVDANQHDGCLPERTTRTNSSLEIEVDGVVVAHRELRWQTSGFGGESTSAVGMVFRSDPLGAGQHTVRVLLEDLSVRTECNDYTFCIGSAENDKHQARMAVLELLED